MFIMTMGQGQVAEESLRVKRSSSRAGTASDLLHSLIIYLFQQE